MEKMYLTKKEQLDLMSDPHCLSIIHSMDTDKPVTKEWLAENLGESVDIISNYLNDLVKHGMALLAGDSPEEGYLLKAVTYEPDRSLFFSYTNYMVSGYLNYLDNELTEMMGILKDRGGEEYLEKQGLGRLILTNSTIKLTREEADELRKFLDEFISRDRSQIEAEEKSTYSLNMLFYPTVAELKDRD